MNRIFTVTRGLSAGQKLPRHSVKTRLRYIRHLLQLARAGEHFVFVIPVEQELDLRKAASAAGEKNIEMIKSKELLPLTGYIHGGCSPVGMKKQFATFLDSTAEGKPVIFVSGGKIGCQIEISPDALHSIVPFHYAPLTV